MRMTAIRLALIFLFFWMLGSEHSAASNRRPLVRIGVVVDGPWHLFPETMDLFKGEIMDLNAREFDIQFPSHLFLNGNWTTSGVQQAVDRLLADPTADLVLALGAVASNEVCLRRDLPKPVIAPFVIDAVLQELPRKDGASGVDNLCCINAFKSFERDVTVFLDIVPFKRLTVIVDSLFPTVAPRLLELADTVAQKFELQVDIVMAASSAKEVLAKLPAETEAVYVSPLIRFTPPEFKKLVDGLIERRLPSFSMRGREEVEMGLFASFAPKTDFVRLARRVALNVQRILLGENAGDLKMAFPSGEQLTINMRTARAIDVNPQWRVLTEADLLFEEAVVGSRQLTLQDAVAEAIEANLDLAAEDRNVAAGIHSVDAARSALLPQIDLRTRARIIDKDRAEASFGLRSERAWTGSTLARQILYSDPVWANYEVERKVQLTREEERNILRLDIVRETAIAYLNVLKAKATERIQKDNLKLTRANLKRAQVRQETGFAGPAEVYRWESKIATSRRSVLETQALTRQAMILLNRLLNRPLYEVIMPQETGLNDPVLLISDKRFFRYVSTPKNFDKYTDFAVQEGFEQSPELRRIDAALAAQKRILAASKRSFWLPEFFLQGDVTQKFAESGKGTAPIAIDTSDGTISAPKADDTDWSIGISAKFPLYQGGAKKADYLQVRQEISRLRITKRSIHQRVEERIRFFLQETSASYQAIELSRDGAHASAKNLAMVTDSYERGRVSIIDLIDAQNAALVAEQLAANAVYDFLIDLMNVQRAIGRFDFGLTPEEREQWFKRIDAFFKDNYGG